MYRLDLRRKTIHHPRQQVRKPASPRNHPLTLSPPHLVTPLLWLLLLLFATAIAACRPAQVPQVPVAPVAAAVIPVTQTAVPTPTLAPPVIRTEAPPPPALPTPLPTSVTKVETAAETKLDPAEPAEPPTATPIPMPTFTPPALPHTSPFEHYWLRRPVAEGGVVWTDKTYPYGSTRGGTLRVHHGVEFLVDRGTEMLAAASGTVVVAGDDLTVAYGPQTNFYGNLVVIELDSRLDGQSVYILYGHLSQVLVQVGQHVDAQQVIAISGASGIADGPHMHFEVRVGQNSYDHTRNPLLWLYPFPDYGVVAGRVTWPNGQLVHEAPLTLRRIDAPSRYRAVTSYAAGGRINPDPNWNENFVFDDVEAGYYELTVQLGEQKFKQELWVYPYQTSFIELVLNPDE